MAGHELLASIINFLFSVQVSRVVCTLVVRKPHSVLTSVHCTSFLKVHQRYLTYFDGEVCEKLGSDGDWWSPWKKCKWQMIDFTHYIVPSWSSPGVYYFFHFFLLFFQSRMNNIFSFTWFINYHLWEVCFISLHQYVFLQIGLEWESEYEIFLRPFVNYRINFIVF